ncbi:ABC transporter substrate-binding protein [Deinococcus ruber]|uniref:Peptide ABC transporter substrate-binding protein n=1 Tax=Deinococcus ruber TaxID=1848197 RepID=A0A918CG32_9DEIO|nr:ABC transporter substrate-binding protein [Deinococcus ruber]GGR21224.1 peptide ABC transporter substrate-binding protein [Deinococcus ruber]
MHVQRLSILSLTSLLLSSAALAAAPSDTLVLQQSSDISTLDPAQAYDIPTFSVIENLYEPLVAYQGSDLTRLHPVLATSWKISPDGKTYTFNLRKGVRFHSGNVFGCADAQYTLQRLIVTNNADSGNFFLSNSLLGTESNAADDTSITWAKIAGAVTCNAAGQLVLKLPKSDPALLSKLASQNMSIVDRQWAINLGEWNGTEATWKTWVGKDLTDSALSKQPSGTGAYKLVSRDDHSVLATAFPSYWGGAPKIKNVIVQLVGEEASRLEALKRGDADVVEVGARPVLTQLQGRSDIVILDHLANLSTPVMLMNEDIQNPALLGSGKLDGQGIPANFFSDVNVRQAFSYAFDDTTYIRDITGGAGVKRTMTLPPAFLGYDKTLPTYSFDKAKATAAFKKAFGGQVWDKGFTLTITYRAGSKDGQQTIDLIARAVESLNPKFHVITQAEQWSSLLSDSKAGKTAMLLLSWGADYADPDNVMYTLLASDGYYSPRTHFADAQIDQWLTQARTVTDPQTRAALYRKAGARAHVLAPYLLMPADPNFIVFRSNLQGITPSSFNPMLSGLSGTYWRQLSKK